VKRREFITVVCGAGVAACRARAAGAGIRVRDATTISIWLNFFGTLRKQRGGP